MYVSYLTFIAIISTVRCHSFGYSKKEQRHWADDYPACGGQMQSPIAISTADSVILPLPAVEMIGFHDYIPEPVFLKNDGHSVSIKYEKRYNQRRIPYIFGGGLNENQEYEWQKAHFHWGDKDKHGSEHTVDGKKFPIEMHMVFKNMVYPDVETAQNHSDGLSVMATFFELQEKDNEYLNTFLDTFPQIQTKDKEVETNATFTLSSILPRDRDTFYTYRGSLTTPPCSEAVTWIVFAKTVPISERQLNEFRKLSDGKENLSDNFRELQDINNRIVILRLLDPASDSRIVNVAKLSWSQK